MFLLIALPSPSGTPTLRNLPSSPPPSGVGCLPCLPKMSVPPIPSIPPPPPTPLWLPFTTASLPKMLALRPAPRLTCQLPNEHGSEVQELKARLAPVLARWQNKLLALALEAFHSNASASRSKRLQVQRALQFWNNTALAGAFAQWVDSVQVGESAHALSSETESLMQKLHYSSWCSCSAAQLKGWVRV